MKIKFIACLLLLALALPQIAFGANPCADQSARPSLGKCVNQIYLWALGLSGILAVLMMVLGGYLVMTAGGNAQQSSKGKEYIMSSIVGLGLLFGAYLILNTINPDLVNFKDPTTVTPAPGIRN